MTATIRDASRPIDGTTRRTESMRTRTFLKVGAIEALPLKPPHTRVVSAHVMGGCGLGGSPRQGVVDGRGRHFDVDDRSVHDGSLFPTSIGANPQLSFYGIVNRMAQMPAAELAGRGAEPLARRRLR